MDNAASLALCIPTYERKDMVEDFLVRCSEYYIAAGIDIYYYDSSISDETETLLREWTDGEHIYYIRMPSELHPNAKAFKIFQGYGLKKKYDFIWLSNDALQCLKPAIEQLMQSLNLKYDMIEVIDATNDHNHIGTRAFTDRSEYMQKCTWHLGLFGAVILNAHTMLDGVNWTYYEERFLTQPLIYFSHVSFYFHRLLELEQFCALHLSMPPWLVGVCELKKTSGWTKNLFYVMCESWVQTIEGLPDYYTNKKSAISAVAYSSLMPNVTQFYRYKVYGIYSFKTFLKYWAVWRKVTSVPRWKLFLVAAVPKPLLNGISGLQRRVGQRRLQKFCASHERLIIYGTGGIGKLYAKYFEQWGITFEAFCVSRRKPKHKDLDHPVYELSELKNVADGIGFVLAMDKYHVAEVLPALQEVTDRRDIFCDLGFSNAVYNMDMSRAMAQRNWEKAGAASQGQRKGRDIPSKS